MRPLLFLFFLLGSLPIFLPPSSLYALDRDRYVEVSPLVAFQSADAMRAMTLGALSITYHHNRIYWFGVDVFLGQTSVDASSGLNVPDGARLLGLNGAAYFNVPALLGATASDNEGLSADLYTSIGVGRYWISGGNEVYGFLGGGMLIHTPLSWLIVRFDLKGLFYVLNNSQGGNFNSDMVLSLGPSLVF